LALFARYETDSSDICDPKRRLKCPRNFRPPLWILVYCILQSGRVSYHQLAEDVNMRPSVNAVGCNDLSCLLGTPCQARLLLPWCFTSTETIRLIREGGYGGGRRGRIIYLSLHCHHQNDPCIKMGSDESHFNVSLIVRDKVTRQCPQTTTFVRRKEDRGPSASPV